MKKTVFFTSLFIVLALVVFALDKTIKQKNVTPVNYAEIAGTIIDANFSSGSFQINYRDNLYKIELNSQTKILTIDQDTVDWSYLQPGFAIIAFGPESGRVLTAEQITITQEPNIIVYSPKNNDQIGDSLLISGRARVFENQLNIKVKINELDYQEILVMANGLEAGIYGSFESSVYLPVDRIKDGDVVTVEAFDYSARDGAVIDLVSVALKYQSDKTIQNASFGLGDDKIFSVYLPSTLAQAITPDEYSSAESYFIFDAKQNYTTLEQAVNELNDSEQQNFGSQAVILDAIIANQEAKYIMPSSDQPKSANNRAALVILNPNANSEPKVIVVYAPKADIKLFTQGLHFLTKVKVYFNNSQLDPENSCDKVFPVYRYVDKTVAIGQATLEQLLKGVSVEEKKSGYFSSINEGSTLLSLKIAAGIARADFGPEIQDEVGGSCRVAAIRGQITATLEQFPSVDEVIISVNGNIDESLQP